MPTSDFYHVTTVDNLRKALDSGGKLSALRHIARDDPDRQLDVELTPLPLQRRMAASKAYNTLNWLKNSDSIHFTKDRYMPNYGDVVIKKNLGPSIRKRFAANSIPEEYTTRRKVSLRGADIYVPSEQLEALRGTYGDRYNIRPVDELGVEPYGISDRLSALGRKLAYKLGLRSDF